MHKRIRDTVSWVAKCVLPKFGVPPAEIVYYRDGILSVPVMFSIFLASKPIFISIEGGTMRAADIGDAVVWFCIAVLISLLSINWNTVIAAAFALLIVRGIIGFVLSGGDRQVVAAMLVYLSLSLSFAKLRTYNEFG